MEFQEYLDEMGYSHEVRHLNLLIEERDRFAQMMRDIAPLKLDLGQKALTELNASIEASEAALFEEYKTALEKFKSRESN
ncbi:MAG: hypothetical protein ABJB40_13895 [Acidobacteriota bacterium]